MTSPLGNSEFCFPRISMFPSTSSWETLRFSGNKIHCSPRDRSLSVYYHDQSCPYAFLLSYFMKLQITVFVTSQPKGFKKRTSIQPASEG